MGQTISDVPFRWTSWKWYKFKAWLGAIIKSYDRKPERVAVLYILGDEVSQKFAFAWDGGLCLKVRLKYVAGPKIISNLHSSHDDKCIKNFKFQRPPSALRNHPVLRNKSIIASTTLRADWKCRDHCRWSQRVFFSLHWPVAPDFQDCSLVLKRFHASSTHLVKTWYLVRVVGDKGPLSKLYFHMP